jgi:histidyl-tRNA synthetase
MATARRVCKVPKGTRDFLPEQMAIRQRVFSLITSVFERHGAVTIETPVFELKETLLGQYGEESKLIYDIADQGGELLSLRYDLTVPFARFLATHGIVSLKRYQLGRVYRRDQPAISRGRFREFYQCDFDIAGQHPSMVADAEVLRVLIEVLDEFAALSPFHQQRLGSYQIKLSHRGLLDAILQLCGVPKDRLRPICSSIDKLDKEPWESVRKEMVETKNLSEQCADRIGAFVTRSGEPWELLRELRADTTLCCGQFGAEEALGDLERLFVYLEAMGNVLDRCTLNLSLARGLDYYTGLIFEAVLTDGTTPLGSIGAGGRYDNLVEDFAGKQVPCVGASIGIERIFSLMEDAEREVAQATGCVIRANKTQVLVAGIGNVDLVQRLRLCDELWRAHIAAECVYTERPKMARQLQYALDRGIPVLAILGESELSAGMVGLKRLSTQEQIQVERGPPMLRAIQDWIAAESQQASHDPIGGASGNGRSGKAETTASAASPFHAVRSENTPTDST